jgi:opacity protein-like surface antigen
MRKVLVSIFAISFSSLVFASGDLFVKPTNYFDGFYAGIGGGVSHTTANVKAAVNTVITETPSGQQVSSTEEFSTNQNADLGETSLAGELFAGYGKSFNIKSNRNNLYLGFEVFGKITPTKETANTSNQFISADGNSYTSSLTAELENHYSSFSFGADLRFGYLITPKTMIYVLAGGDVAPFAYMVEGAIPAYSVVYGRRDLQWRGGFMPGVGIESMLTDHWSLRAQYVYSYWGDGAGHYEMDLKGSASGEDDNGTEDITGSLRGNAENIQRGLFTIDLTYHF